MIEGEKSKVNRQGYHSYKNGAVSDNSHRVNGNNGSSLREQFYEDLYNDMMQTGYIQNKGEFTEQKIIDYIKSGKFDIAPLLMCADSICREIGDKNKDYTNNPRAIKAATGIEEKVAKTICEHYKEIKED